MDLEGFYSMRISQKDAQKGSNMALPQAVQAQLDRANQILAQEHPVANPNPQPPVAPSPTPVPGDTIVAPPAIIAPPIEPVPPAPIPSPAPVAQPPVDDPNSETWKQRFQTLQGKYNAEVPRYAYRVAFLENQVESLTKEIGNLKLQLASPQPPAQPGASITPAEIPQASGKMSEVLKNSTDEKIKAFKDNFPDIFEAIGIVADQMVTTIRTESDTKMKAIEQSTAKSANDAFLEILNRDAPGWQQMCQTDPNWPVWLGVIEDYTGKLRLELLKEASTRFDAKAVLKMLRDFRTAYSTQPVVGPVVANPNPPAPPAIPGAAFVGPPSAPSAGSPSVNPPEQITRKFVSDFYLDVAKGRYRGRDAERITIEAKINRANIEGRIV